MITLLFIYFVAERPPDFCLRELQAVRLFVGEFNEATQKPPSLPPTVGRQRRPLRPLPGGAAPTLFTLPQLRLPVPPPLTHPANHK